MSLADRPVDEVLKSLSGAARDAFLSHKALFIESLLSAYHLDPSRIGYRRDIIEEFLLEHCSGLTVSECFSQIERMIREAGGRRKLEDLVDALGKSIEDMANAMTRIDIYCLSWGLDREECDELKKIERDPCLDAQVVEKVLSGFFKSLGVSEQEYRGAVEEVKAYIDKLRRSRLCVRWDHVVNAVKNMYEAERVRREETIQRARGIQRSLEEFLKRLGPGKAVPVPTLTVATTARAKAVGAPEKPAAERPRERKREIPAVPWLGRPPSILLSQLANRLRELGKGLEIVTEGGSYTLYSGYWAAQVRAVYSARGESVRELRFPGAEVCVDVGDIATTLVIIQFRDSFFMWRDNRYFCCRNCIQYYRSVDGRVKMYWT